MLLTNTAMSENDIALTDSIMVEVMMYREACRGWRWLLRKEEEKLSVRAKVRQ